jgi:hypothetical protein
MKTLANREDRDEVIARLRRVSATSERRWGQMTAAQMLCHLADSYRVALGEKKASSNNPGLLQRTLVKRIALYMPMHWPKGVPTMPEVKQGVGGTDPDDFEADRADLIELVIRFPANRQACENTPHPLFGKMSYNDWMRWGYLHADHHLRQFGV